MKNGQLYYVSNVSEEDALKCKMGRLFIGKDATGIAWFERGDGKRGAVRWLHSVEIPEPKLVPWTDKTRPVVPFTITNEHGEDVTVIYASVMGVTFCIERGDVISMDYEELLENEWHHCPNGNRDELLPCGVES